MSKNLSYATRATCGGDVTRIWKRGRSSNPILLSFLNSAPYVVQQAVELYCIPHLLLTSRSEEKENYSKKERKKARKKERKKERFGFNDSYAVPQTDTQTDTQTDRNTNTHTHT